ncbi:MAG: hypothetical protein HYX56_00750 [Chloroflexi bacterium]|nr:hypothetical protein [Chloroflexota bacterium]
MRGVIGQGRILGPLGERAVRGEVAHALGFYGPRSVGKRTAALRLAQTLACEREMAGGCGTCLSCRKIERGTHPDVRMVTRSFGNRGVTIEQVRELASDLALRPLEGRKRVVIIDDAGGIEEIVQDVLLRNLEEPPSHAVLILLTTTPSSLLGTIRSRAQPITFRLVPADEIAAGLVARGIPDAERYAAAAAGLPGVAIDLATGESARADRAKIEAELYGLISSGLTARFSWAADMNELPDDKDHDRLRTREIRRRFDDWSELLRDAAVAARGDLVRPRRPERAAQSMKIAAGASPTEILGIAALVERLRRDLAYTANARAMLELFVLRLPHVAAVAA